MYGEKLLNTRFCLGLGSTGSESSGSFMVLVNSSSFLKVVSPNQLSSSVVHIDSKQSSPVPSHSIISNPITSHMEIGCLNNAVCPGGYTARTALGACHVYCASCTTAHIYLVISQSRSKEVKKLFVAEGLM